MAGLLALILALAVSGRSPRPRVLAPVRYTLIVDSVAATSARVEIRIASAPDTLRLAMATHPEYDDRFWRYVRDVTVERGGRSVAVVREDSALWRVTGHGDAVVRYRVEPPPATQGRGSWVGYLSSTGGLLGGPHTFMYVVGGVSTPARVTVRLPNAWSLATGMARSADGSYAAADARELIDSPIMVGLIRHFPFTVAGVPHEVAYLPSHGGTPFDTTALVAGISRFATEARAVFGRFPYKRFAFLVEEGAGGGGLEHGTSVNLAASTTDLANGGADFYADLSHEYFHAWNEVALRPKGWGGLSYRNPTPTREMWWMEGVTMYYASLLSRRARLPVEVPSRAAELALDIGRYLDNQSNVRVSPEEAGWWNANPGARRGDLSPDYYLQGKLLGAVLDLRIRAATRGRRSLDDAMRRLFTTNREPRGYIGRDIERAMSAVCGCAMRRFFDANVRQAGALDFDAALAAAGLRADVAVVPAAGADGAPLADTRVWASMPAGTPRPRLVFSDPDGAWARAGLRSGDLILTWNGDSLTSFGDFRTKLRALHIGDSVAVSYARNDVAGRTTVRIVGYDVHRVRLVPLPGASREALAIRRAALLEPVATDSP